MNEDNFPTRRATALHSDMAAACPVSVTLEQPVSAQIQATDSPTKRGKALGCTGTAVHTAEPATADTDTAVNAAKTSKMRIENKLLLNRLNALSIYTIDPWQSS
jgi:hypothetical protein